MQDELKTSVSIPADRDADDWLAPVFLDERAAAYVGLEPDNSVSEEDVVLPGPPYCHPIRAARISDKAFLLIIRDQTFRWLMPWTGWCVPNVIYFGTW